MKDLIRARLPWLSRGREAAVPVREGISEASDLRERFRTIYFAHKAERDWESVSGPGSSLEQTASVREVLPVLFRELRVATLLDAACGDFNWMKEVDLQGIRYVGADIVPELIAENRRRHAAAGREFRVLDLVRDPLPRVDLILCRDCLVHLPSREVKAAVQNMKRSGSTFLLTTTFPGRDRNEEIPFTGGWCPLNLELPPFNFPPPHRLILEDLAIDGGKWADKSLGLWRLGNLPD